MHLECRCGVFKSSPWRCPIDVAALDCDFLAFSAHKMYGPTGLGVLYGRPALLEAMSPYQVGGGMVTEVTAQHATYAPLPHKFEAGTPHLAGLAGFVTTLDFLQQLTLPAIVAHEAALMQQLEQGLTELPRVHVLSHPGQAVGALSFNIAGQHPLDVGLLLDAQGILIRTGTHCAQPLVHTLGVEGTVRVSLGVYNTQQDLKTLLRALAKL